MESFKELTIPFRYFTYIAQNDAASKVLIYHSCRRKFVDTRKSTSFEMPRKRLRSSIDNTFDWKTNCFLCAKKEMRKYSTVARVETLPLIQTLVDRCESREDRWGYSDSRRVKSKGSSQNVSV